MTESRLRSVIVDEIRKALAEFRAVLKMTPTDIGTGGQGDSQCQEGKDMREHTDPISTATSGELSSLEQMARATFDRLRLKAKPSRPSRRLGTSRKVVR